MRPLPAALAAVVVATGVVATTTGAQSAARPPAQPWVAAPVAAAAAAPAAVAPAVAVPTVVMAADSRLTSAVRARMATSTAHAWSAVVDVAGRRVVSVAGGTGLPPASTEKLFTALPALLKWPHRGLTTSMSSTRLPSAGVLRADLVVKSSGDPTLRDFHVVRLARSVRAAGIRVVTGRLVLDIGSLPTTRVRSGWKSSYVPSDIAPLSPFPINGDRLRSTSAYVANPTAYNLAFVRSALKSAGVTVKGSSVVARHVATTHQFTLHGSVSLLVMIRAMLLDSINFTAEQLLSIEGRTVISGTAKAAGATNNYATDGSGLSLSDRASAGSEVALLEYAARSPAASLLRSSLPVACRSGTLEHLLCGTATAGQVWAKTGTLNHAKTLAGYTTDGKGRAVTFAILTNGDASTTSAMTAIGKVLTIIRGYTG